MPNIFEGALVRLRAVETSDWETFYQWDFDSENGRLTDEIWLPSSREATKTWTEEQAKRQNGDEFRFIIETLKGDFVGTINTHTLNPRCGTFMYGLGVLPEQRRKGYASEAIRLVLRYYFQEKRYQKVNAEVYSFNTASQNLHKALGFTLEGRLRLMIFSGGEFHDTLIYGMTREEFESKRLVQF